MYRSADDIRTLILTVYHLEVFWMKGIAYGVGVGPGDPELITYKAIRLIRENNVIAVPGPDPKKAAAYKIAAVIVPEIAEKEVVSVSIPMSKEYDVIREAHKKSTGRIEAYLEQGKNVVYLTLGDPTIYSSFSYLQKILEEDGYQTETVSGVPSFCAAAARLKLSLAEWNEPLHILPAAYHTKDLLSGEGKYILMKSGSHMKEIKKLLQEKGMHACAVANCGMETEKVYDCLDEFPEDTGYFMLVIAGR